MNETPTPQGQDSEQTGSMDAVAGGRSTEAVMRFIEETAANYEEATNMTDTELATAIRREITDQMPMDSLAFALLAEATERLLNDDAQRAKGNDTPGQAQTLEEGLALWLKASLTCKAHFWEPDQRAAAQELVDRALQSVSRPQDQKKE